MYVVHHHKLVQSQIWKALDIERYVLAMCSFHNSTAPQHSSQVSLRSRYSLLCRWTAWNAEEINGTPPSQQTMHRNNLYPSGSVHCAKVLKSNRWDYVYVINSRKEIPEYFIGGCNWSRVVLNARTFFVVITDFSLEKSANLIRKNL